MKSSKVILVSFIILGVIVGILLYNKSRSEAKSRNDVLASVPVSVVAVRKQQPNDIRTQTGIIAANSDVAIVAETQGKVTAVRADVGDHVSAGATIIQLDDEIKHANLATAEANYQKAKRDLERYESLVKENAATDQQLEASRLAAKSAEAQYILARRQYRDTKISSPVSGIVTSRNADVGTMVLDKTVVANVVDISRLKVKVNVAERDVFRLKVGDIAEVSTDVYPGVRYQGKIRTIGSKADEAHTYPVEINFPNSKDHPLKAGMFSNVSFTTSGGQEALAIPREALLGSTRNPQVFVLDGSMAMLRDISIGSEFGTKLTVVGGLKEGEIIVVTGQNNLRDKTPVRVVK